MLTLLEKARRLQASLARRAPTPEGREQVEAVELHGAGYAEPGYGPAEVVALGNWNAITRWDAEGMRSVVLDQTPCKFGDLLERMGVALEWSDEWAVCVDCGKLVRTQPDSYSWTRSYWESEGGALCHECVCEDPREYLESLEGNARAALTIEGINLPEHGYRKLADDFQNGWHGGQDADPGKIAKALHARDVDRFVFEIESRGQFDTRFGVWVHESEWGQAQGFDREEARGADPAEAMKRALQSAPIAVADPAKPGHIPVTTCHGDGTSTTRLVSPQDFVEGRALD